MNVILLYVGIITGIIGVTFGILAYRLCRWKGIAIMTAAGAAVIISKFWMTDIFFIIAAIGYTVGMYYLWNALRTTFRK